MITMSIPFGCFGWKLVSSTSEKLTGLSIYSKCKFMFPFFSQLMWLSEPIQCPAKAEDHVSVAGIGVGAGVRGGRQGGIPKGLPKGKALALLKVILTTFPKRFVVRSSEIPVSRSIAAASRAAKHWQLFTTSSYRFLVKKILKIAKGNLYGRKIVAHRALFRPRSLLTLSAVRSQLSWKVYTPFSGLWENSTCLFDFEISQGGIPDCLAFCR